MAEHQKEIVSKVSKKLQADKMAHAVHTSFTDAVYYARDNAELHGTYQFEQQMLAYIRQGKTNELEKLFSGYPQRSEEFREGKLAKDALRQTKNIFIGLVAVIGKTAAIPGGMPIEEAYYLIDSYTQQCETLTQEEDVYVLQYQMVFDFTRRVERYRFSKDLSPLIRSCINYIIFHLNEPINTSDVIRFSGRSKSSVSTGFKEETGLSINQFITRAKIDEAKALLQYSSRSIAEISSYLSFSSQPYFQNVFKRIAGVTPQNYREQNR